MYDPMETIIRTALVRARIAYVGERDPRSLELDFYLPDYDVHIEVKQFHSPRIVSQMARAPNVIVIQGIAAAKFFAERIAP